MPRCIPILLTAALGSANFALGQSAPPPPQVTEDLICERPADGAHFDLGEVSSDLLKVVWVADRSVIVNGEALAPAADKVSPVLSPDGRHLLRVGRLQKSWFVWLDAQQVAGPFDEIEAARFTADGRVVFAAKRARTWTWFVDGQEQLVTTPEVGAIAVASSRVAFATKRLDGWRMVVDGQVGPPFERIDRVVFSPDATRLAYVGTRQGRAVAVVDGQEAPVRDGVEGLVFSADSKRVAYLALDTSKEATGLVVTDGVASRPYPTVIQNVEDELHLHRGRILFQPWTFPELAPFLTGASAPLFRSDGALIYAARTVVTRRAWLQGAGLEVVPGIETRGQEGIWVEGSDKPLFEASLVMAGPVISEVGDHLGWVEWDVRARAWVGFVDGHSRASAPGVPERSNSASHVTLSHDGSRLAFVQVAGKGMFLAGTNPWALRRVVATDLEGQTYDALEIANLRFSDDGKHLAYEVHGAKGLKALGSVNYPGLVVLDGVPGPVYSDVMPGSLRFVRPDAIQYVARRKEAKDGPYRYYRVTHTAP